VPPVRAAIVDRDPGRHREEPGANVLVAAWWSLRQPDERLLRGVFRDMEVAAVAREVANECGMVRIIEGLRFTGQKAILTPTTGRIGKPRSNSSSSPVRP
jgi:hypothetical protein